MTAVCAIAFSLPRYAVDMYIEAEVNQVKIGSMELVETDDLDEYGDPLIFNRVVVTEANIEELQASKRSEFDQFKQGLSIGIVVYCSIVAAIAFLFVPVVSLTLSRSGTWKGVRVAPPYICSCCSRQPASWLPILLEDTSHGISRFPMCLSLDWSLLRRQ